MADPGFRERIQKDSDYDLLYRHGMITGYLRAMRKVLDVAPEREAIERDIEETEANAEAVVEEWFSRETIIGFWEKLEAARAERQP